MLVTLSSVLIESTGYCSSLFTFSLNNDPDFELEEPLSFAEASRDAAAVFSVTFFLSNRNENAIAITTKPSKVYL